MKKGQKQITGIILSGGKSSRMGREKGLVKFQGKPLVEYVVDTLKPLCDKVVISTANDEYEYLGLPLIKDEIPDCGPIGGIWSCMKRVPGELFIVVSCDIPFVSGSLLKHLFSISTGFNAVVPVEYNGRKQPLCAIYDKSCLPIFEKAVLQRNFKMMRILDSLSVKYIEIEKDSPHYSSRMFYNVNNPEDLNSF